MLTARRLGVVVALSGFSLARVVAAGPVDSFGLGSRSVAMGGAVSADVSDFSATHYNPSGLVRERELQVGIELVRLAPALRLDGASADVDASTAFAGGLVAPGSVLTLPFSVGLSFHLPSDQLSRVQTFRADEPRFVLYDNRLGQSHFELALALRPLPGVLLGAGLGFLAGTHGRFDVSGSWVQPIGGRSEYDSQLSHQVDAQIDAVHYPTFGATILPNPQWAFALVYREQAQVDLRLRGQLGDEIDLSLLSVPARYVLQSHTVNAFVPRQLTVAASFAPLQALKLDADVSWQQWSHYESPVASSRNELDVPPPAETLLGLPSASSNTAPEPRFSDRLLPRVGAEYSLSLDPHWVVPLRIGYSLQLSPVPNRQAASAFLDADAHVLSVGSGLHWRDPGAVLRGSVQLDAHFFLCQLSGRSVESTLNATRYEVEGRIWGFGLSLGVALH